MDPVTWDEIRDSVRAVVAYAMPDEEADFAQQDDDGQEGHIVHHLRRLEEFFGE